MSVLLSPVYYWLGFPKQAEVGDVAQSTIDSLGWVGGPIVFGFFVLSMFFILPYPISKGRFLEFRAGLERQLILQKQ